MPEVIGKPDAQTHAVFETGDKVGNLACALFPDGREIPYEGTSFDEKITLTQTWMTEGLQNIYEATFRFEGILVMVDILHINDDGTVEINEVKSSTGIKDVYVHDASIQYYVLNGLGYKVKKTNIVHIDNSYVREETLDIEKLFVIADISAEVLTLQDEIPKHLAHLEQTLSDKKNAPHIDIGTHCTEGYGCDAMAYCWKHIPEYSIFDISRLQSKKKFTMYEEGVVAFSDITDLSSFSSAQQIQIRSEQKQKSIINKEAIQDFVASLRYPLYYLDFETFQQAIPEWKGIKPFMQIPFQYSLHIEEKEGGLMHREFLAKEGMDPRYALAKSLVENIPSDVDVLAYNMGFEKGVIRNLAETFSTFSTKLMQIHDNIHDLMLPFQRKDYYVPSMRGSYSIKYVLPALVPQMAKAYNDLDGVQNGGEAMHTYAQLSQMKNKDEVLKLRASLLKYCKLDTLAMVKIMERLKSIVSNP
jgi:hypothetical protein